MLLTACNRAVLSCFGPVQYTELVANVQHRVVERLGDEHSSCQLQCMREVGSTVERFEGRQRMQSSVTPALAYKDGERDCANRRSTASPLQSLRFIIVVFNC